MTRATPLKVCCHVECSMAIPNATLKCPHCGFEQRQATGRSLHRAISVLMDSLSFECAQRGLVASEEQRRAWAICFKKIKGYDPTVQDFQNAHLN